MNGPIICSFGAGSARRTEKPPRSLLRAVITCWTPMVSFLMPRSKGDDHRQKKRDPCVSAGGPIATEPRGQSVSFESFAQAFQIALRGGREALLGKRPRLGRVHDVLQRSRQQHLADARVLHGRARELVEHGATAVDRATACPVMLDGPGEVGAETVVQKVIVVADLEARLGEKVGEIAAEVVADLLQTIEPGISQRLKPPVVKRFEPVRRGADVEVRVLTMQ